MRRTGIGHSWSGGTGVCMSQVMTCPEYSITKEPYEVTLFLWRYFYSIRLPTVAVSGSRRGRGKVGHVLRATVFRGGSVRQRVSSLPILRLSIFLRHSCFFWLVSCQLCHGLSCSRFDIVPPRVCFPVCVILVPHATNPSPPSKRDRHPGRSTYLSPGRCLTSWYQGLDQISPTASTLAKCSILIRTSSSAPIGLQPYQLHHGDLAICTLISRLFCGGD